MPPAHLAPVVDLDAFRRRRQAARQKILQAANRQRILRARYVGAHVWHRQTRPAGLLSVRHLQRAVAICRHWGLVDGATLEAAGFRPPKRQPVGPARIGGKAAA